MCRFLLGLYSTATPNHSRLGFTLDRIPNTRHLRCLYQHIGIQIALLTKCKPPHTQREPQRKPVEYSLRWVRVGCVCVGHVHLMLFVSFMFALGNRTRFLVEYFDPQFRTSHLKDRQTQWGSSIHTHMYVCNVIPHMFYIIKWVSLKNFNTSCTESIYITYCAVILTDVWGTSKFSGCSPNIQWSAAANL